jgi:hypothetical protein
MNGFATARQDTPRIVMHVRVLNPYGKAIGERKNTHKKRYGCHRKGKDKAGTGDSVQPEQEIGSPQTNGGHEGPNVGSQPTLTHDRL